MGTYCIAKKNLNVNEDGRMNIHKQCRVKQRQI